MSSSNLPRELDRMNALGQKDIEVEVSDDVLVNDHGVPPPRTKRKRDLLEYEEKLDEAVFKATEKAFKVRTSQYKVQKALAENDHLKILQSLLQTINSMDSSIKRMDGELGNIKSEVKNMKSDIDKISTRVEEMTPLMHHVRVAENLRRRELGLPQLTLPFLVGEGPVGTGLPQIVSVYDIQDLSKSEILRYLAGYDVGHDRHATTSSLRFILRMALGFTLPHELHFTFS